MIPDSDSSSSSQILFPVSDDVLSDAMDVVRSDENTTGADTDSEMHVVNSDLVSDPDSDCIPHHILLCPNSPVVIRPSMSGSEVTAGFERDPNTGRFTAASFANFPDDLLD